MLLGEIAVRMDLGRMRPPAEKSHTRRRTLYPLSRYYSRFGFGIAWALMIVS